MTSRSPNSSKGTVWRRRFDGIPTPKLLLDLDRAEKNIVVMRDLVREQGLTLRQHVKTSKCVEVAKLFDGEASQPIAVSTLKEARFFGSAGFRDILYTVAITPEKLDFAAAISDENNVNLRLILDDLGVARRCVEVAGRLKRHLHFLIEIDSGDNRGGIEDDPTALVEIAKTLREGEWTSFDGIMTHAGRSYGFDSKDEIQSVADESVAQLDRALAVLGEAGIDCSIVSLGATPIAKLGRDYSRVTEMRAGVFVFNGLAQASRGICSLDEIAISVLATVIGHNRAAGSAIVDAGALALSKDLSANERWPEIRFGQVCDAHTMRPLEGLSVTEVHQEHGEIRFQDPTWIERLPIGTRVRILPNHACLTAAAHESYTVVSKNEIVGEWGRINGW